MTSGGPPKFPENTDPAELGFRMRRAMVRWFSPRLLAATAVRVGFAGVFGSYSDKREIEAALPAGGLPSYARRRELWIDYVADLGDAFGTVYSVASLLAEESLVVGERNGPSFATKRGNILVFGGDEVYPTPSVDAYTDRTAGPYEAALPYTTRNHPHLYAVPGNHDWYDGLTSFLRVFCRKQWIGGWQTHQTRSYFALELHRRWWLWGIDIQLDVSIDEPQLEYFRRAAEKLTPRDAVILCSALPSWVFSNQDDPEAYSKLDYFERKIIRPTGARVALSLTGDKHHYARYEAIGGSWQKITAGGGGAYTSGTHSLPEMLVLPPEESKDKKKTDPPETYYRRKVFPDERTSRRRRWFAFFLPFRNPSFAALVGAVHLLFIGLVQAALRAERESFRDMMARLPFRSVAWGFVRSPLAILVALVIVYGFVGFTRSGVWWKRAIGAFHGLAHLAAVIFWIGAVRLALHSVESAALYLLLFLFATAVGGGLVGSWVLAFYLAQADRVRLNSNELFAAQRMRTYKNFLRLHIDKDGVLTIYPIGLRKTSRVWTLREGGDPLSAWFTPKRPLSPELIEAPITVDPYKGRRPAS